MTVSFFVTRAGDTQVTAGKCLLTSTSCQRPTRQVMAIRRGRLEAGRVPTKMRTVNAADGSGHDRLSNPSGFQRAKSRTVASWNQLDAWLRQVEALLRSV